MSKDDPMMGLRARAYELADTGRYEDWEALSADLVDEDTPEVIVRRLGYDALFQTMLKNRISAAKERG